MYENNNWLGASLDGVALVSSDPGELDFLK